jgi:hypothetical protein
LNCIFFLFYTPSIHLCKHTDENLPATTDAKNLAPQQKSAGLPKFANQSTPLSPEKKIYAAGLQTAPDAAPL